MNGCSDKFIGLPREACVEDTTEMAATSTYVATASLTQLPPRIVMLGRIRDLADAMIVSLRG